MFHLRYTLVAVSILCYLMLYGPFASTEPTVKVDRSLLVYHGRSH